MKVTRRDFMKISGVTVAGATLSQLGFDLTPVQAYATELRIKGAKETTTVCCYCSVGCGQIVHTGGGKVINIEGDPDHPTSEGALCAKGAGAFELVTNPKRLTRVMYRAPNSTKWEEKSWDWAFSEIAKRIKKSRDAGFVEKNAKGQVVNRCDSIAAIGSAHINNEEGWLYLKFLRSLGLIYIEHEARLCHSSTVAALAESYGRGAMTNNWRDIGLSDCVLIMGSNAAEMHPIVMKWVLRAKDKGAKIIHVDPRFTRTSARADIYAPFRSGTDIAFLGGMINYILQKDLIFKDYVVNYTNASFIVGPKYDFKDGLFSGYNPEKRAYDKALWAFEKDEKGICRKDPTLQHERCVYQLLKKHYARYDLDTVSSITGTPKEDLIKVYETFAATGKPDKVATILYAMGWTQHTTAVQLIRAASMIQLLLGNIGVAGGGVNAMRGESNVQGITDHAILFHIIPAYNPTPRASDETLSKYNEKYTPKTAEPLSANWWSNRPKYMVSLLKSYYGKNAIKGNDFGYGWHPKLDDGQNTSFLFMFDDMLKGKISGFICLGMNPACSLPNANQVRKALSKLDWMVDIDIFENETSSFWKGPGMNPKKVKTEVFLLPAAMYIEKEGSISDSGRMAQWRYKAIDPLGESKDDGQIVHELYMKVKALYEKEKGVFPDPILKLKWDYAKNGKIDPHLVAKEINGYDLATGKLVVNFTKLMDDGTTSCGNWLYSGSYNEDGNLMARRDKTDPTGIYLFPKWAWSWPVNRRIIYNRASVDLNGNPWDPKRAVIKWDAVAGKWVGDVPDGGWPPLATGKGKLPFIMKPDGVASIFGPGLADGPFPEHYEPLESPIEKNPLSSQRINPATVLFPQYKSTYCDPKFPFVATTFRLTEHWQTGLMTRYQSWLIEAQPQIFVEIGEELAAEKGIKNGERVLVSSIRGKVEAVAIVTKRLRPLKVNSRMIHQIGLPWCYGWLVPKDGGDSANLLTPTIGDANTLIPESKAFLANVEKLPEKKPAKKGR